MTKKELATVLAALRYWQQDLEANDAPPISETRMRTKEASWNPDACSRGLNVDSRLRL